MNALSRGGRRLRPIRDRRLAAIQTTPAIEAAADPHRPIKASEFLADFSGNRPPRSPVPVLVRASLLVVSFTMLTLAWRYTPLSSLLGPQALQTAFSAGGHWGPVLALGLFLMLGFLAFPVNILIIATAAAFGIWPGLLYAAAGTLISATVTYFAGRKVGPGLLRNLLGPRINRISQKITQSGIIAITMVRMVPIAPFTLINLIAGAMRIRFSDYIIGTGLGLLPGVFLLSALGDRLSQILERPSLLNTLALTAILLMWVSLIWLLQKFASRTRSEGACNR